MRKLTSFEKNLKEINSGKELFDFLTKYLKDGKRYNDNSIVYYNLVCDKKEFLKESVLFEFSKLIDKEQVK